MAEKAAAKKQGWTRIPFGDVVRLCKERSRDPEADGFDRYVGLDHLDPGDLKIRRWGDVADGTTFTSLFRPGQVLFGKRRAYQRKVAVADFSGVCSGDIYVFEPKDPKVLLPELLPFICQTDAFFEQAVGTSAGSLSPRTNWKSLAAYEFALPPLEGQRQIVEALQAALANQNAHHLVVEKARSTLESDLVSHLNHGAQPLRRKPTLPVGWDFVRLGDLIEIRHGFAFDGELFTEETTDDPILLTPGNFSSTGDLHLPADKTKRFQGEVPNGYWLEPGNLVVLMTDLTPAATLLGMPGIVSANTGLLLHNQRIGLVRNEAPTRIRDAFLFYSFLGNQLRRLIRAVSAGSTVSHTSPSQICSLRIPLPPLDQQDLLVERWGSLSSALRVSNSRLTESVVFGSRLRETLVGIAPS